MPASFDMQPAPVPLARSARVVAVFKYDPGAEAEDKYTLLPNVRLLAIQWREGADPGAARFRYAFGDPYDDGKSPFRIQHVYPLRAKGPRIVQNDDRLVVRAFRADGYSEVIFDGFAQVPEGYLDRQTEAVTFVALGTPVRFWDKALGGAVMRDATKPAGDGGDPPAANSLKDTPTNLPARFNPDGQPNATPDGADSGPAKSKYPVFLGPLGPPQELAADDGKPNVKINGALLRTWSLGMAARYVICLGLGVVKNNGIPAVDSTYMQIGELCKVDGKGKDAPIDKILKAIVPKEKGGSVNLKDPNTFKYEDIEVADYDVCGEAWPVALERLIDPHGFTFQFLLETTKDGDPSWRLAVYRKDDNTVVKSLQLQKAGAQLDPGQTNVGNVRLARDATNIENSFVIYSAPTRIEASFVLAPNFTPVESDATTPTKYRGQTTSPYREYVFDECSEGHWDLVAKAWVTDKAGDLKPVFNPDKKNGDDAPKWVNRRRVPRGQLISRGDDKKRRRAVLHVSANYGGPTPGVYDGSGKWQEVHSDDWELLPDRLGIKITALDPNAFKIGVPGAGQVVAYAGGDAKPGSASVLKLVEWIAKPTDDFPAPRFRLTCVIEDDQGLDAKAERRSASPTTFEIRRAADSRDRFGKMVVSRYSCFAANPGDNAKEKAWEDDTADAKAHADGLRRARELGNFAGSVFIPRFSTAYGIGDKLDTIKGRDLSLQQSAAVEQGETAIYPAVVAISYNFDGEQSTTLELSDRRSEPPPKHRESRDD